MTETQPVIRYRVNDYVGPPIWAFRTTAQVAEGDRVHYDDKLFDTRRFYTVTRVDGRLACRDEHERTIGFIR